MATVRKRPGRPKPWEARYRDPSGRSRSKSFARKSDAQRFLTTVEADKLRGRWVDPSAGRVTFAAFAEQWLQAQVFDPKTREGTASRLHAHLTPAFGDVELRGIRPSTVQAWVASASRDLAPSYVRLLLATLSTILGAAVEDGLIVVNPCRSRAVSGPKVPRRKVQPWTVEQVSAVVAAMPARYRATAVVAAGCGLRQGEVFGLRVVDVDFLRHAVHVRQQVKHLTGEGVVVAPPKRGKTRTVPLSETVAAAVSEHLRAYPAEGEALVFTNTAGGPINRGGFNDRVWKPALEAAGIAPTRANGMHMLRHTYASVLLAEGVSIRAVADYLGHESASFTLHVYTHLMPDDDERARAVIDAAFGARVGQAWASGGDA